MPNIEVQLPAGIGEGVQILAGDLTGHLAMVMAWRVTQPRFLLGGSLDGDPRVSLLVVTGQGEERWLEARDVVGLVGPVRVVWFLPFAGRDEVLVNPSRSLGVVRWWEITGRRLENIVTYRIHLAGTPPDEEIVVDERYLELRPRI